MYHLQIKFTFRTGNHFGVRFLTTTNKSLSRPLNQQKDKFTILAAVYANNKVGNQYVHPHNLINTCVVRCLVINTELGSEKRVLHVIGFSNRLKFQPFSCFLQ